MSDARRLRCAVYTRKSSETNLDLDFNSLHAQREAAEAYIKSQKHEGWRLIKAAYDDGGFSGGSMERPALQRLLADVRAGQIDVVVVYKVDRLTRSLADFAKLVEAFDRHRVSFVSITQQFNTTTSMGRLTLNVLLSFAQFEREVAGERIRDKVAASRAKGLWMGGCAPLGYTIAAKKLIPHEAEAETVRSIFKRYLDCGCVSELQAELSRDGITSKRWTASSGRQIGGKSFSRGVLYHLLRNRVYLGDAVHKGVAHTGEHRAIIDRETFAAVQVQLTSHRNAAYEKRIESDALLTGLLWDDRGHRMSPTWSTKRGGRYRYYVSQALLQNRKNDAGSRPRIAAVELERRIASALLHLTTVSTIAPDDPLAGLESKTLAEIATLTARRDDLRTLITRAVLSRDRVTISCPVKHLNSLRGEPNALSASDVEIQLSIPLAAPGTPGRTHLIPSEGNNAAAGVNAKLLLALAKARQWARALESGTASDFAALARKAGHHELYVRRLIRLAWLAPDIVQACIEGRQPRHLTLSALLQPLPHGWAEQRAALGFGTEPSSDVARKQPSPRRSSSSTSDAFQA